MGINTIDTYKEAEAAIKSGDIQMIEKLQQEFGNLTTDDLARLNVPINEEVAKEQGETQEALTSLRETILIYQGMIRTNSDRSTGNITTLHSHGEFLSDSEYTEKARYVLSDAYRLGLTIKGDTELFLFQSYFNDIHSDTNDIGTDGVTGPQTIGAITSHVRATQVFLKELGADVNINGNIDDKTKAAIKEYFGFDIVTGAAEMVTQVVVEEIERIQNLTDAELLVALQEANKNLPEKLSDKRIYIAEYVRRYKEAGNSVVPDSNNRYTLVNISNTKIDTSLSQQDLQSIMVLLATNGDDIFNRDLLKENIANNIFDHVVKTFDFKKSNGRTWQGTDFVSDNVRSEDQVQENKTACVGQIDVKILELREKNKLPTTTDDQRKVNILAIQKLEIAKIFVVDQTRLSEDALVIARSITDNRVEIARALGTSEEEITRAYNQIESGDWKDLAFSMIGPGILALIFGFLSRLIPEGAMRTAFNASIVGLLGITAYSKAQEMGLTGTGQGSTAGRNNPNITTPAALQAQADIVRSILTAAPKGLESRHKDVYVKIVQLNNEPGKGYFDDRKKLDTTYLVLSQDPVFAQQDTTRLNSVTAATAFELISSPYAKSLLEGQGITGEELMSMMKMLIEVNSDSEDTKAQDLFIAGQVTDTLNNADITWVQGESFEALNLNINKTVSKISGISFGADESLRSNSVRAQVEEALAKAQPNTLEWMGQAIADRTSFIADQEPTAANIGEVIVALQAITATGNDDVQIQQLIIMYENIQETLSLNEGVYAYLSEAKGVYTYIGAAGRLGDDVITWVQGWGDPIPVNPNAAITPESIQELIDSGVAHADTLNANEDLQKEVLTAVENLRLYKIKMLDDAARAASLTPTERDAILSKSDEALAAIIAASPEIYMATLDNLEIELAGLKNTYTSTDGYLRAFSGKKAELVTLQRLARITTGNTTFDTKAATIYNDIYTAGFATNLKSHLSTKITEITSFDTTLTILADVNTKQTTFNALRDELLLENWVVDLITYFGMTENTVEISGEKYLNVPDTMDDIFNHIDSGNHTAIAFDESIIQTKQTELDTARLGLEGGLDVTVTPLIDTELLDPTKMSVYVTAINAMHTQIEGLSDGHKTTKGETLRGQVSDVVDRLAVKLDDPSVGLDVALITPIVTIYSTLITNELGNAGNVTFKNTLAAKYRDIKAADYETMLDETTFNALQPETSIFITRLKKEYYGKYSLLDIELELIVNPNATLRDITDTLKLISDWDINDMGTHQSGAVFDTTTHSQYASAARSAKSGIEGAISSNEVRARMARAHGGLLVMLEELGII